VINSGVIEARLAVSRGASRETAKRTFDTLVGQTSAIGIVATIRNVGTLRISIPLLPDCRVISAHSAVRSLA
jgi:hypothetical protein